MGAARRSRAGSPAGAGARSPAAWLAAATLACAGPAPSAPDPRPPCARVDDASAVSNMVGVWFLETNNRGPMRRLGIDTEMTPIQAMRWEHCSRDRAAAQVLEYLRAVCPVRDVPEAEARRHALQEFRVCADGV